MTGQEEGIGDQGRHHGAADHRRHQGRVLRLVDELVGQPEEGRDGAEGEPVGHQECGVEALLPRRAPGARHRVDPQHLGEHFAEQQQQEGRGKVSRIAPAPARNLIQVASPVSRAA